MSQSEQSMPNSPVHTLQAGQSLQNGGLLQVINKTRNTELGNGIEAAKSGPRRSKGLLGRKGLPPGGGMWIIPCEAIHTFFMQFPIDVVYLDKKLRIRKVVTSMRPWRLSACLSARSVLELPSGTIDSTSTQRGDVLEIVEIQ